MNREQRKALQDHMNYLLGYSLENNGAAETLREIRPDAIHTWALLGILEQLENINETLVAMYRNANTKAGEG